MSDQRTVRILLTEDNPADVYLLRHAFSAAEGVRVDLVLLSDGEAALNYFEEPAAAPPIDLIVLDLNLPKADGADVLRSIRGSGAFESVPVAILTSSNAKEDRDGALELGADAYLTKPTNLDDYMRLGPTLLAMAKPRPGAKHACGSF